MRATYACSHGIAADAKIDYFGDEGRRAASLALIAMLPEKLRFEVTSDFGFSPVILTSNGTSFALLDNNEKTFLHGPASACNVARFTRVEVPPFALVQLLRGEAPVLVHQPEQASISWTGGRYAIEISSKHEASQLIELVPQPADFERPWQEQRVRVTSVRVVQQGYELYRADLAGHARAFTQPGELPPSGPTCDAEVPRRVRLQVQPENRDVLLRYDDVVHNPPIVAMTFEQTAPPYAAVRRATCR
jgi:hypothetical protein